ncbi:ribosome-associated heat shock protein Hsp15 [Alteromonas oceanisediminis]|uniref:ribosome-associated heat shock protein Hsp15 n=1 Tax=Alteromonas oceanisediminis TaxID=2836180 RepID=UPI001BDA25DD|nr:ribosome-associated heat shock protein Hsp15 [Alteromonas oceanisediminis]MBT0587850.1 ribosome-associated heat shock protein Hsp15 [Alteromonas oceanisediminis]
MDEVKQAIRLDKWLWAARFFKTRALAREAVQAGKVQYNGQRSKPGKTVELGARVCVPSGYDVRDIEVIELFDKRRAAPLAQQMYRETPASMLKRQQNAEARKANAFHNPHPDHRPDKKQRRQLIRMKQPRHNDD